MGSRSADVATRALSKLLGHAKTRRLYAHVAKDNIASIRVLEKCGFGISGEDTAFPNTRGEEVEEVILMLMGDEKNKAQ
jgi:RimJ/RimL family protein N-acetyltransferase